MARDTRLEPQLLLPLLMLVLLVLLVLLLLLLVLLLVDVVVVMAVRVVVVDGGDSDKARIISNSASLPKGQQNVDKVITIYNVNSR